MTPPDQPQNRSDSRNQDGETHGREPVLSQRTTSTDDLTNDHNRSQAIRLADGPGSGSVRVNRERLAGNVRGRTGLESRTEARRLNNFAPIERFNRALTEAQRRLTTVTPDLDAPRQTLLSQERTTIPEATLEPHLVPALGQDTPLNSTQQLDQPGQPRSYMPSLRSQPEFYMTGVTAVDTTAEPLTNNTECSICLEPLLDDVVKFHACGHMFHTVCVQSWFDQSAPRTGNKRGTCPNCRHELYEPDPQYGRTAPPRNVERPVMSATRRRFALAPPDREEDGRREELVDNFVQSRNDRSREASQNTGVEQAPVVTPQPLAVTRRPRGTPRGWGELNRGYQLPHIDALERARDDLPPRTSSLAHGAATRRQHASQIMTNAIRATESRRDSHARDGRVAPDESDDVPNVDESPRVSLMTLERSSAPTPTVNQHPVQPRESRAILAARAIAERRPLPGTPVGINYLNMGNPGGMAGRSTRDLQDEQTVLLDRLRVVQNQIGQNLQEAETTRERRANAVLRPTETHLLREAQEDLLTRRPPPIAIPHLADPSISDLRSAREFPDPRSLGSGTSIWSADHVAPPGPDTWGGLIPSGVTNIRQPPQPRQYSRLPNHQRNAVIADTLARVSNNNDQTPPSAGTVHAETSSAEQPSSTDNQRSILEDRQLIHELRRQLDEMRRLVSDGFAVSPFLGPTPMEDDVAEAPW